MAYIYKITNSINGKIYIGKTYKTIEQRFKEHFKDSKRYKNRPLYRAINKYGIESFKIEVIEKTNTPEEREKYWIQHFNSYHNGYNATLGGDGKPYIDYDLVVKTYLKLKSVKETAKFLNIDAHNTAIILKSKGIKYDTHIRKKIVKYDKNGTALQTYDSILQAAKEINKIRQNKNIKVIVSCISRSCKNNNTAYGYKWSFL